MNKMLITSAGLAEIVNAEQSGTAPVVLSYVAFGTGQYTATPDMTALKSEFKRLDSVAGGAIADNMIHLTVHDNSADAYTVNEVGVFTASGTLFAVYSATTPIMEKSATSESMLAIDITLTDIDAASISFGNTNIILNPATTDAAGIVELATDAEAKTGTDTTRAMTPATAKAARDADANIVHRSGNETIAGKKTFTGNPTVKATTPAINIVGEDAVKGTAPESDQNFYTYTYDKNRSVLSAVGASYNKAGEILVSLQAYKPEDGSNTNAKLGIAYPENDSPYTFAPTPAAGDNSTKIPTTAWVNTKTKDYIKNTATGENAIAVDGATAAGNWATAMGSGASAKGSSAVAVGSSAKAPANGATAVGPNTNASGAASVALGDNAFATDEHAIQIGQGTNSTAYTLQVEGYQLLNLSTGEIPADRIKGFLPLSGGAMTADKAIYRNVNTGHLALYGGTGENNDGAQLDLCGSAHSSMPGAFLLHARNGDTDMVLRGQTDGILRWDGKYVLNNSFTLPSNSGAIILNVGPDYGGAGFRLYGGSHSSGRGAFALTARTNSTDGLTLEGYSRNDTFYPGQLLWDGNQIVPLVASQKPTSSNNQTWYRKYADGWVEQGGVGQGKITLPVPMADTIYSILAVRHSEQADYITTAIPVSTTQVQINIGGGTAAYWRVCGYAAS